MFTIKPKYWSMRIWNHYHNWIKTQFNNHKALNQSESTHISIPCFHVLINYSLQNADYNKKNLDDLIPQYCQIKLICFSLIFIVSSESHWYLKFRSTPTINHPAGRRMMSLHNNAYINTRITTMNNTEYSLGISIALFHIF